jgi:hypothetical protein
MSFELVNEITAVFFIPTWRPLDVHLVSGVGVKNVETKQNKYGGTECYSGVASGI